jgi:hypothetical protein
VQVAFHSANFRCGALWRRLVLTRWPQMNSPNYFVYIVNELSTLDERVKLAPPFMISLPASCDFGLLCDAERRWTDVECDYIHWE